MAIGNRSRGNRAGWRHPDAQRRWRLKAARPTRRRAVKETARQFEALFMNMMLKSMREADAQDGMFDSEQTKLYTSMLDQQLSQPMARRGIGLAEVLARQLMPAAQAAATDAGAPTAKPGLSPSGPLPVPGPTLNPASTSQDAKSQARTFIERIAPDAEAVSRDTGIPVRFLLGHAALESGWGRAEIRAADGTPSHNLFGIKAGAGLAGPHCRGADHRICGWRGSTEGRNLPRLRLLPGIIARLCEPAGDQPALRRGAEEHERRSCLCARIAGCRICHRSALRGQTRQRHRRKIVAPGLGRHDVKFVRGLPLTTQDQGRKPQGRNAFGN